MLTPETFDRIPFFASLSEEDRGLLRPLTRARTYRKGDRILAEGERSTHLRILLAGLVSFRQSRPEGGEDFAVGMASERGDVFGLSSMVGEGDLYPHCAVCLEDCEVLELDAAGIQEICDARPETGVRILRQLVRVMAHRLSAARDQLRSQIRRGFISHG